MGTVYKLTDGEKVYYGSTTATLKVRLSKHKQPSHNCRSKQLNRDKMTIELVEWVEDETKLLEREGHYIKTNECVNYTNPNTTPEERKLQKKKYNSKPYQCQCGSLITLVNRPRHERSKKHKDFFI